MDPRKARVIELRTAHPAGASNRNAGEVAARGRRSAAARLKTCEMLPRLSFYPFAS